MFDRATLNEVKEVKEKWIQEYRKRYGEKEFKTTSYSGIPLKFVYTPEDISDTDYKQIGMPGIYPYTRGLYPIGYRVQPWVSQQATGYGLPEQTRERYELLSKEGLRGYEGREPPYFTGQDQAGILGYDADHPVAKGWVGMTGPSVNTFEDFELMFEDVDISNRNLVLGVFDTSPIFLAWLVVLAEKQGIPLDKLHGLSLNSFFRQMYLEHPSFPPQSALKINREFIKYCTENVPHWNTVNFNMYDIIECGGNAIQELAFILSVVIALTEECIKAGLDPNVFVTRFNFHMAGHMDFFETIAKIRAVRRMWAKIASERLGCQNPRALKAIINVKTAGATYTRQQPLNNLIRGCLETLAAVLGEVNALWTTHYDDPLAIPTEQSAILGLRTQQIILHETGIPKVSDPLAGSYYVEWLTNKIEEEATKLLERIEDMGGWVKCLETGWFRREIDRGGIEWRRSVDRGETVMVGVNKFVMKEEQKVPVFEYPEVEEIAIERLKKFKEKRDTVKTKVALAELKKAAQRVEEGEIGVLMPAIIEGVKVNATMGEMMDALKEVFGWGLIK
jgi:methylmalonyl-CoA mutase N-terminal domain/subunit